MTKKKKSERWTQWLTVPEAAQHLGYAPSTIYHKVSQGRIPHVKKDGRLRFEREVLDAWMREDGMDCRRYAETATATRKRR